MKRTVLFTLLILFWIVVLFPKHIIWEKFEQTLEKRGIPISAKEVDIQLYLLYNRINIKELIVLDNFDISKLVVDYNVLNPLHVTLHGDSQYGKFESDIALMDKKGYVLFKTDNLKDALLKEYFKKDKDGMKYEFNY